MEMSLFEREKRKRNLAEGFKETKGLPGGHCNRRACQAPLAADDNALGERYSMRDHETFSDGRLYYCFKCADQFDLADIRNRAEKRISIEALPPID